jgi:hypothetical protein
MPTPRIEIEPTNPWYPFDMTNDGHGRPVAYLRGRVLVGLDEPGEIARLQASPSLPGRAYLVPDRALAEAFERASLARGLLEEYEAAVRARRSQLRRPDRAPLAQWHNPRRDGSELEGLERHFAEVLNSSLRSRKFAMKLNRGSIRLLMPAAVTGSGNELRLAEMLQAEGFSAAPDVALFAAGRFTAQASAWDADGATFAHPATYGYTSPFHHRTGGWDGRSPESCGCRADVPLPGGVQQQAAPDEALFTVLGPVDSDECDGNGLPVVVADAVDMTAPKAMGHLERALMDIDEEVPVVDNGLRRFAAADLDTNAKYDPIFGHETFIAEILRRQDPTCVPRQCPVMSSFGVTTDFTVARILGEEVFRSENASESEEGGQEGSSVFSGGPGVLNLSFGGYTIENEPLLALGKVIKKLREIGWRIVASAGNEASCRPVWPAAEREVLAIAATGPVGPAPFTNFGSWVNACAPGHRIVSEIPNPERLVEVINVQGEDTVVTLPLRGVPVGDTEEEPPEEESPEPIGGDAAGLTTSRVLVRWSGTSFSAPVVAGEIARRATAVAAGRSVAAEDLDLAVYQCIDDPVLLRLPGLGTVVNMT